MQGAQPGTRSWVSRITPWAEGGAKPLSHPGVPYLYISNKHKNRETSRFPCVRMSASAMGNPGQCIYSPRPLLPANSRHHTFSSANKCFCAKVRFQIYLLGSSLGGAGARLAGAVAPGPSMVPGSHGQRGRVRGCGSDLWGRWRVGCGLHRLAAVRASEHAECAAAVLRIRGACACVRVCTSLQQLVAESALPP